MLRHDQNASSADEAVDPSKEKDGRPDMIDRAPRVQIASFFELDKNYQNGRKKGYVVPAFLGSILIVFSQQMISWLMPHCSRMPDKALIIC